MIYAIAILIVFAAIVVAQFVHLFLYAEPMPVSLLLVMLFGGGSIALINAFCIVQSGIKI